MLNYWIMKTAETGLYWVFRNGEMQDPEFKSWVGAALWCANDAFDRALDMALDAFDRVMWRCRQRRSEFNRWRKS